MFKVCNFQVSLIHPSSRRFSLGAWSCTSSMLWAHYISKTPRPRLRSVWERSKRIFYVITLWLCYCALLFAFVCVCCCDCALVYVFHSLPYSKFDCDHLCKVVIDSKLVEIPRKYIWCKEDIRGAQLWSLDHLSGVECNPWPKEVTTTWSRPWPNHGKNCCLLSLYFIAERELGLHPFS